ncbi:MAG: D-2-hydroxyacid dehydrogenase [Bacteroidota bacterium]
MQTIDALIFQPSYDRIKNRLAEEYPYIRWIVWQFTGQFKYNGELIEASEIQPEIAWISFDVIALNMIDKFVEVALGFDSVKWIQTGHAGLDAAVYPKIRAKNIRLSKSWVQSLAIAEFVMAHSLYHLNGIPAQQKAQAEKKWQYLPFKELSGSNVLIVGFGSIGKEVAKRLKAFGSPVTVIRQSGGATELAQTVRTPDKLLEVLPEMDVIILACPLTDETRDLGNQAFFEKIKKGALLINVARGEVLVDEALVAGLAAQKPAHAVLDVFREEPLPGDHPFWTHPQVTVSPHTSSAGHGLFGRGDELFFDNLNRYFKQEELIDEVREI